MNRSTIKHSYQRDIRISKIFYVKSIFSYRPVLLLLSLLLTCAGCKKDKDNSEGDTAGFSVQLMAGNLVSPVLVLESPDGTKRLFVVDQVGRIWIVKSDGTKLPEPFIDIQSKMVTLNANYDERGLLGMAFHPDYKNNGKFYLFYTAPPGNGGPEPGVDWNNRTHISEFRVSSSDVNKADISSEKIVLQLDHPQMNHNGGTIAFGPDGYLYISIGDGGGKDDVGPGHVSDWYAVNQGGNAQNVRANLLGKISRINVNTDPYSIPSDNPLTGTSVKREIYAYGFRNPYRFSFDMGGSHQLIVGDAGQSLYEEIDVVTAGGNYGWNVKEGTICFNTDSNTLIRPDCPSADAEGAALINPVIQLKNAARPDGQGITLTIIGGYVYRGNSIPGLAGKYIFGSFSKNDQPSGQIFSSTLGSSSYEEIPLNLAEYVKGLGQDLSGEIYVTTSAVPGISGMTGKVYKLKQ